MKMRAIILACMIVMSGLIVVTTAQAQPYTGNIVFRDNVGNPKDYFDPSDRIYFDVTVLSDGTPLQDQSVNVTIVGDSGIGEVFTYSYLTNSFGQFSGDQYDGNWYPTNDVGYYTMYVNYSGNPVVSDNFRIYNAVPWTATGRTLNQGVETDIFTEDQQVTMDFLVMDQHGNPFDSGWSELYYVISRDATVVSNNNWFNTNNSGGALHTFNLWNQGQNQFGAYTVTVYNSATPPQDIGSFSFRVVLPDLATIQLTYLGENRTVFRENEWVGYEIALFRNSDIPYDTNGHAARVLLFKDGEEDSLVNNTLNTDADGIASTNTFHRIETGEEGRGTYTVEVYNQSWHLIGSAIFMVIEIDIGILPEKASYAQGDTVTLTVTTTLEEAYRVRVADNEGVALPAASWNVPAGTAEWWKDFTFPGTLPDGDYRVEVLMDDLLLAYHGFTLKKINLQVMLSQTAFVPGQIGTVFWRSVDNHDGGPIPVTGESLLRYTDDEWETINKDLPSFSGSSGNYAFTVPKDTMLMTMGQIELEAEDTSDHTDTSTVNFQVRDMNVWAELDRYSYRAGDTMFITLYTRVDGSNYPVPDVDVDLTVERDGTRVGSTWTVRSNSAGIVSTTFQIPNDASKGIWVLVINATFDRNKDITYDGTRGFDLLTDPIVSLDLRQEKNLYTPGESVVVPYRVLRDGAEVTGARVTYSATITQSGATLTVSLGFGDNGIISFTLPSNVEGSMSIYASATTSDGLQASDSLSNIQVSSGRIVLFSDKSVYLPGELVTWSYILTTDTELSAMYRITNPDGVLLAQGTPQNGTISFQLPAEHVVNPTANVYVTASGGTYYTSNTAQVYQGYILDFRVLKNSYSPGDIMKINYTIRKVGDVPDNVDGFQITINIMGEHSETVWVTELAGVLEYQLSENITDGKHLVNVGLSSSYDSFQDIQTVIIDSKAGELAHGTILGMNAGAFIVLIIALLALVLAIVGLKKLGGLSKARAGSTPPEAQPPEPAPPEPVQEESYQYPPPSEEPAPTEYPTETSEPVPDDTSYQYPPPPQE